MVTKKKHEKKQYITNWNTVPVIIDIPYVSVLLGMNPDVVRKKTVSGEIPGRKIGREWRYNKSDIMRYLGLEGEENDRRTDTIRMYKSG